MSDNIKWSGLKTKKTNEDRGEIFIDSRITTRLFQYFHLITDLRKTEDKIIPENNADEELGKYVTNMIKNQAPEKQKEVQIDFDATLLDHMLSDLSFQRCEFQQKIKESSLAGKGIFSSKWHDGQDIQERLEKKLTEKRKTAKYVSKKRREEIENYFEKINQPKNLKLEF